MKANQVKNSSIHNLLINSLRKGDAADKTKRPWGEFANIRQEDGLNIKIIKVKPQSRLSLQSHKLRDEVWFLSNGNLYCQIKNKTIEMKKGLSYFIPKGSKHRLWAEKTGGEIVEISSGKFDEQDIVRYQDDYGRVKES